MIRLISYNVEYGKKINEIYKWLNTFKKTPDIICFQEFPSSELGNLKEIKIFNNSGFSFATGLKKNGVAYGELTVFDAEKFNLIKSIEIDLGIDHVEKFYKRYPTRRSALVTVFKYNSTQLNLINVHLSAAALNSGRLNQVNTLVESAKNGKSIIAGDFNYSNLFPGNNLIKLMKDLKFKLAGENIITNKYKGRISQQLDYVFYKELKLKNLEVIDLSYSDHYPLIAEFEI